MRKVGGYSLTILGWWFLFGAGAGAVLTYAAAFLLLAPEKHVGTAGWLFVPWLLTAAAGWGMRMGGHQLLDRKGSSRRELKGAGWGLVVIGGFQLLSLGNSEGRADWFRASELMVGFVSVVVGWVLIARARGMADRTESGVPTPSPAASATSVQFIHPHVPPPPESPTRPDEGWRPTPRKGRIPSVTVLGILVFAMLGSFALGAFGGSHNWTSFATGHAYSHRDLEAASAAAFVEGERNGTEAGRADGLAEGHRSGFTEGYNKGQTSGYSDGITTGKLSGYSDGYLTGYRKGCLLVFDLLHTDRLMDFWDFYHGYTYAHYYNKHVCSTRILP